MVLIRNSDDLDLCDRRMRAEARQDFLAFRQYVNDDLITGWWQEEITAHLQWFYRAFISGRRPKMALLSPPQHGKSTTAVDFIAWVSGLNPDIKSIYASYSEDLGIKANLMLQRIMLGDSYKRVFANTQIPAVGLSGDMRWQRNNFFIEFVNCDGNFRNVTVNSGITGQGLDLGVIDDPVKGRKEANSKLIRDSTWSWFTDDFFTRFSERAALLLIMTRWHVDDVMGRFIERFPNVRVVSYPAIATQDEPYRKVGDPLFPELKSLDFLRERQKMLTQSSWEALYQQNPIIIGGGIFPVEQFRIVDRTPPLTYKRLPEVDQRIRRSVRYWDKAGTEDGGAYTAGVLMHELRDNTFMIEDVRRGQWSALERERHIKQAAELDGKQVSIYVEQEPGSGGKESAENTVRMLRGWKVFADRVTGAVGSKETRAEPLAAQVQGGNVALVRAPWNRDFLDECETFPNGKFKDQVDAASGAFNKLVSTATISYDRAWIG